MRHTYLSMGMLCCTAFSASTYTADNAQPLDSLIKELEALELGKISNNDAAEKPHWTISPFDYKRDFEGQLKLYDEKTYINSLMQVSAILGQRPSELILRNAENSVEGYIASLIIENVGLIELCVQDHYEKCHALLTHTVKTLKDKGAAEARITFNLEKEPNFKLKSGYKALCALGFEQQAQDKVEREHQFIKFTKKLRE